MSTPRPQEFPEGSGTGGGGRVRRPGHINELPPFLNRSFQTLIVQEVLRLRNRIHGLESRLLTGQLGRGASSFNPAEFPEGGEGGGEIVEIIGEIVEIAEFPQVSLANEVASVRAQLASLEQRLTSQIAELKQVISSKKGG